MTRALGRERRARRVSRAGFTTPTNRLRSGGELKEQGFDHDARRDEATNQADDALAARQRFSVLDFTLGNFEQFCRGRVVSFEVFEFFEVAGGVHESSMG